MRSLAFLVALTVACSTAADQDAVVITAVRDPVQKSYRRIVSGMELFERKRAMAPAAELRFKLLPRKRDTDMKGIELEIVGKETLIPLDIAPDRTFALPRDAKALAEDAAVSPNRRRQSMTWRADIRTPGLPPNTRRLGDLRLECEVGMRAGLISNEPPVIGRIADFFAGLTGYCDRVDNRYLFFSDRPLFGVALAHGARREVLPIDRLYGGASYNPNLKADLPYCDCEVLLDRSYTLPLGDRSWPDETLVELEHMDDAPR
ncbi:MAG: hypothetical protein ACT4P4_23015 [Betaproteobacteria bacterium]